MKHLIVFSIFCAVLSGCTKNETIVESSYDLVQAESGRFGYHTSSDGSKILLHDPSSNKFQYINRNTGDTTLLNQRFGFYPLLSPKGDSILYIENLKTLKLYDIAQDSSFTLYKGDSTYWLWLSDWNEQSPEKVLLTSISLFKNVKISYYDLNKKSLVDLIQNNFIAHDPTPQFNADASKIGYNDLDSTGEWSAMVLDIKSKEIIQFNGENFLGWTHYPEGLIVTKKHNQDLVPFYIPMSNPEERIKLAERIEPDFKPANSYGDLYLRTMEYNANVEIFTLENGAVSNNEEIDANISWQAKASWNKDGNDFYYVTGSDKDFNGFEIREYFNNNNLVLTPEDWARFGGHAANIEVSPNGDKILVQGRLRYDTIARNGGIHIYSLENNEPELLYYADGRCPSNCYEWPTWLNSNEIIYAKWEGELPTRSIGVYNINTGIESILLPSTDGIGIAHLSASPDGESIAYISWSKNEKTYNLNMLDLALGKERTLASFDSIAQHGYRQPIFEITWSQDSEMMYYAYTDIKTTPQLIIGSITKTRIKNTLITRREPSYPYGLDLNPNGTKLLLTKGKNIEKNRTLYKLSVQVNE